MAAPLFWFFRRPPQYKRRRWDLKFILAVLALMYPLLDLSCRLLPNHVLTVTAGGLRRSSTELVTSITVRNSGNRDEVLLGAHLFFPRNAKAAESRVIEWPTILAPITLPPGGIAVRTLRQPIEPGDWSIMFADTSTYQEPRGTQIVGLAMNFLDSDGVPRSARALIWDLSFKNGDWTGSADRRLFNLWAAREGTFAVMYLFWAAAPRSSDVLLDKYHVITGKGEN